MKPVVFQFHIRPEDYRAMSYFNSFSIRRGQSMIIVLCWMTALIALMLNVFQIVELTEIMQLCAIVVSLALPVMVFSTEQNVRRFRDQVKKNGKQQRTIIFEEKGVKFRSEGESETGFVSWNDFLMAFETKNLLLLYRDNQHTVIIPKEQQQPEKLEQGRVFLKRAMEGRFKDRS